MSHFKVIDEAEKLCRVKVIDIKLNQCHSRGLFNEAINYEINIAATPPSNPYTSVFYASIFLAARFFLSSYFGALYRPP